MKHDIDIFHDPFDGAIAALTAAGLDPIPMATWVAVDQEAA
jgi:hypothetical protein